MKEKTLIVASNNAKKIEEIKNILPEFKIVTLKEIGFDTEIVENGSTFRENALIKAQTIAEKYQTNCIADDSGLCVDALNGAPGVHSARYAGEDKNDKANNLKLLNALKDKKDRSAYFVTSLCYFDIQDKKAFYFEGEVNGVIANEMRGNNGFGYDPIFIPEGLNNTFAEIDSAEKNKMSHRARALERFCLFMDKASPSN
jgi:XTP/dITP diphosphohydrolase